jgi:hypothetical protein
MRLMRLGDGDLGAEGCHQALAIFSNLLYKNAVLRALSKI